MKMLEKDQAEDRALEGYLGLPENGLVGTVRDAVPDRVARDLGVPWHKVGMHSHGYWARLGFTADPEEFKLENISEAEKE